MSNSILSKFTPDETYVGTEGSEELFWILDLDCETDYYDAYQVLTGKSLEDVLEAEEVRGTVEGLTLSCRVGKEGDLLEKPMLAATFEDWDEESFIDHAHNPLKWEFADIVEKELVPSFFSEGEKL